jgi:hypothetical protein
LRATHRPWNYALNSAGLTTGAITQQCSSAVAQGTVITENPAAGTSVAGGTTVSLVISEGAAPVTTRVPNVIGDTQGAAAIALADAELTLGTIGHEASAAVPLGVVLSQTPAAGNSVTVGSAVNVVLSSGPPQISVVLAAAPHFIYSDSVWQVAIDLKNNGNVTAESIVLNSASLNGISTPNTGLKAINLAPGASLSLIPTFPATVTSGVLKLSGTYTAATLSGNWSVSARVTVPPVP